MPPAPSRPAGRSPLLWLFFGLSGRIGRGVYWLAFFALQTVTAAVLFQAVGEGEARFYDVARAIAPFVGLASLWASIAIAIKRLHDFGASGWWAVLLVVPFVNILVTIWTGIVPGVAGPNPYGDRADAPPA